MAVIEYAPIYRLPQETELEGWAEVIDRDSPHYIAGTYQLNPFVFGMVRFLADTVTGEFDREKVVGRVFRVANIRTEPPVPGSIR